jgi:non-canonical purine NTP pyrophosphatase (RdgB/HAM1 family)
MNITFITGNDNKAREVAEVLGTHIQREKLELEEIQSLDLEKVSEYKARQAYAQIKKPVLVEDVSLVFHAFGQLPGPFIKFFNEQIGIPNLPRLLATYEDKSATASVVYTLFDGQNVQFFHGEVKGTITESRGENGFGFDRILIPQGQTRTMAEMTAEEKHALSHRGNALKKLKQFLQNQVS